MNKLVLKATALAIGALMGGAAMAAAVDLDAATPTPIKYAAERDISTSVLLESGAAADQTATVALGASLGSDVTAYVRFDLSSGTFTGAPAFAIDDSAAAAATVSIAQGGAGQNYVIFAVTPTAGNNLVNTAVGTLDTDVGVGNGVTVTNKSGVNVRYRLFETLTAAANPTAGNTLKDTDNKSYIAWANALTQSITGLTATADVNAAPSYTLFTGGAAEKPLAKITVDVDTTVALPSGAAIAAGDILTANSDVTVAGDFAASQNDDGTFTGAALARVNLDTSSTCSNAGTAATTLTATTATFSDIAAATLAGADLYVCLTAEGSPEIPSATYTATIDFDAQANFAAGDLTGAAAGTITRNGVRMVAPLTNQPTGWISRLVLTNTGSTLRDYTITYVTEAGVTVTPSGAGATGTLAANSTKVIDLTTVLAITGTPRATAVVTVNAPQSEIDGLYQIVSTTGALSNYVLSYKN